MAPGRQPLSQLGIESRTLRPPPPGGGGSCTLQRVQKPENVTFFTYLESEADGRKDAEHRGPGGRAVNRQGQVLLKEPETTFSLRIFVLHKWGKCGGCDYRVHLERLSLCACSRAEGKRVPCCTF